jgi:hypothetical protein
MSDAELDRVGKGSEPGGSGTESFQAMFESGARVLATGLGFIVVLVGLWATLQVFQTLLSVFNSPQGFEKVFAQWVDVVGGDDLDIQVNGNAAPNNGKPFPMANFLAAALLGGGALLLTWLSLGIMLAGAKIITWTSGDREAVRKILQHAFGPSGRP